MTYLASAATTLQQYGPIAWGAVGIASALVLALIFVMISWAHKIKVRARYDDLALERGSLINPLDSTFERKRIILNDFVLPSHPYIDNKTFIDCDLIGPSNIHFSYGNLAQPIRLPIIDAVWLAPAARFSNGIVVSNCIFRNCSFQRVTMFGSVENFDKRNDNPNVNWIGISPTTDHVEERNALIANAKMREIKASTPEESPVAAVPALPSIDMDDISKP